MSLVPNVVHPKQFRIGGYLIGVATYFPVSDAQAAKIAMHAFRSRKWTKKDLKKAHLIHWIGDRDALAMLG